MIPISDHIHAHDSDKTQIALKIDRRKLAKRRWRGQADDNTDFGFDLVHPLSNGHQFHETDTAIYYIEQTPENVLKIPFTEMKQAAYYGWMVGNLHFSAAFETDHIIAEDDPAVRQMLDRNEITFEETTAVFRPTIVSHGHSH